MTNAFRDRTVDQVREFIDRHKADSFQLIDVRQNWEYEQGHLPGANNIPLPLLADNMSEFSRDMPVIVYCASGGRSRAASMLFEGQGFGDVTNMVGGFMAWNGDYAFGAMELGMGVFTGAETPTEAIFKAYAMEDALQGFYLSRADLAETRERIELFAELAGFEDKHKDTLYTLYTRQQGAELSREAFEEAAVLSDDQALLEGGATIDDFLAEHPGAFDDDHGILQLASMIETQAMDYYLRCAARAELEETAELFRLLAREEKAHLKLLGKFMDRRN